MASGASVHTTPSAQGYRARQLDTATGSASRFAVILAGGEGARLHPFTQRWLGEDRPKQFCAFTGTRTMLEHTVDRALALVPSQNVITVIGPNQGRYLNGIRKGLPGRIVEQPHDRGTAMAIFLGVTYAMEADPEATVVVYPSDQFVKPEKKFQRCIEQAYRQAERNPERLILLGATPHRPETEYGWIEPGVRSRAARGSANGNGNGNGSGNGNGRAAAAADASEGKPMSIKNFHERPRKSKAENLMRRGCYWNTMIIAARAKTLWAIGWQMFPDVMRRFEIYRQVLHVIRNEGMTGTHEKVALNHIYRDLKSTDFSREVLQYITRWSTVMPIEGVQWCDVGQPQKIKEALESFGGRPAFPMECLDKIRSRRH